MQKTFTRWPKKRKHERVDKTSNEAINKTYAEYKQHELNEKGKKQEEP